MPSRHHPQFASAWREFDVNKGHELRSYRVVAGVSQGELARVLHVDQGTMCRMEKGSVGIGLYRWHVAIAYLATKVQ